VKKGYGLVLIVLVGLITACSSRTGIYDLPSADADEEPTWIGISRPTHDSLFVPTLIAPSLTTDFQEAGQIAQTRLHGQMTVIVEEILDSYLDEHRQDLSQEERFDYLQRLPLLTERIMGTTVIQDGWVKDEGITIVCALDTEKAAQVIIDELDLPQRGFAIHFKRELDRQFKESNKP